MTVTRKTLNLPADPEDRKPGEPLTIAGHVPSFIPAGTQAELDATGTAINPFTGEVLTK